jgi:carbonic anhydrase
MVDVVDLLAGNDRHVDGLPDDYFTEVQDGQRPRAVSMCCSDSRVSQEGMWDVNEPGWLFTPSTIGNQVWDVHDGERVVDGNLLYPVAHTGTRTVAVVGHTGCGAVTAAYNAATGDGADDAPGIEKWVELLVPVVEDGLASDAVDESAVEAAVVNQLVEYNVDRQVSFLVDADVVPDDADVYGFVYDFQGIYGDALGRAYLVNHDGETDTDALAAELPDEYEPHVRRLLD